MRINLIKPAVIARLFVSALLLMLIQPTWAKVTLVYPGADTLTNAIGSSSPNDTLVLMPGAYTISSIVSLEHSLTIRAASAQERPVISGTGYFQLKTGDEIKNGLSEFTIQGVEFSSVDLKAWTPRVGAINLLQNKFINNHIDFVYNGYITKQITAVGNFLVNSRAAFRSGNLHFAANKVVGTFYVEHTPQMHIIGNDFTCRPTVGKADIGINCTAVTVNYSSGTSGVGYIIANKVTSHVSNANVQTNGVKHGFLVGGSKSAYVISNNLVEYKSIFAGEATSWLKAPNELKGFQIGHGYRSTVPSSVKLLNNVVVYASDLPQDTPLMDGFVIGNGISGVAYNNVVVNAAGKTIDVDTASADFKISNNICFNNAVACGDGFVSADPKFASDYTLLEGSPAIDAGYTNAAATDLDQSATDIGLHGGIYGYQQYIEQLADSDKPYVFPIFSGISASDATSLNVKVLSVARLK